MQPVTIHNAKSNLSKYVASAKKGQPVFIGAFGVPEVKLVAVTPDDFSAKAGRDFSVAQQKVREYADSFSEETEDLVTTMLSGAES